MKHARYFDMDKNIWAYVNGGDVSYWIEGKGKKPVLMVVFHSNSKIKYGKCCYRKIVYLSLSKPKYVRKAKFTKAEKESFLKVYDFKFIKNAIELEFVLSNITPLDYSNLETKD